MTTSTIVLLILSAIVAFGLAFYQYLYKAGNRSKVYLFLALLRFITLFAIFVLLINPVISRKNYQDVKTPLPVIVDNSQSVKELRQDNLARILAKSNTTFSYILLMPVLMPMVSWILKESKPILTR